MAIINFAEVVKPTANVFLLLLNNNNYLDHLHAQDLVKFPTYTIFAYTVVSF